MPRYDAKRIETKWQTYWDQHETFKTGEFVEGKEKLYVLDMFPYPSGDGLHVGHPEGYTATDIVCRHARMQGKQVLHPMGWDAFGLPAEQHAIKTGTPPRITTQKNIDTFRRQLKCWVSVTTGAVSFPPPIQNTSVGHNGYSSSYLNPGLIQNASGQAPMEKNAWVEPGR